jgi:hypothetical protein
VNLRWVVQCEDMTESDIQLFVSVKTDDRERYSVICTDVRIVIQGQNFNFIKFLSMEVYRMKSVVALGGTEEDTEERHSLLDIRSPIQKEGEFVLTAS